MDPINILQSDPSILLLNEIEILLAQTRLMELYLKQAQATAANEIARINERHQGELAALRAALATKEVGAIQPAGIAPDAELARRLAEVETALGVKQRILDQRAADLDAVNRRAAAEKEAFETAKQSYVNELAELHHEIAVKERELTQRYEAVTAVELALHGKIQALQQEIARSHNERTSQEDELIGTRDEIAKLRAHVAELESARALAESTGKRFVENTRQRVEDELNRLHATLAQKEYALKERENAYQALEERRSEELRAAKTAADQPTEQLNNKINELQLELAEKQLLADRRGAENGDLRNHLNQLAQQLAQLEATQRQSAARQQEAAEIEEHARAQTRLEQSLRAEIDQLVREGQERNQILQNRNDELVRVKSEMDAIHERLTQLELAAAQSEAGAAIEAERMRTELQAQLALLQAELSQKQWALEDSQAAASGTAKELRQEIATLREQLAEQASVSARHGKTFGDGATPTSAADSAQRRWRTGFAWKRRWKD